MNMSNEIHLTRHARVRMQQRGVRPQVLSWLLEFGAKAYDGHGGHVRYFDERARRRIGQEVGADWRRFRDRLDTYAVVAHDGGVVTVGHRYRRRRRR